MRTARTPRRRRVLTLALALALFAAGWGAHAARAATAPTPIVAPAVCAADVAGLVGQGRSIALGCVPGGTGQIERTP